MKTKTIATILVALALAGFGGVAVAHEGHKGHSDMSKEMVNEPHHALAMAYHHNLTTFAKTLHEQTSHAKSVNVEFARAAVAEMRRSFDQMKQHHEECAKAMSPEMQTKMKDQMEKMEMHHDQVNQQLTELEKEVALSTPDAKRVSTLTANLLTHLDDMSKGHGMHKMKMKM